ncbi:MAG: peptidoglycan DD-metalloendopeptidase family protein [Polyangiales bacterium]
MIRRALRTTTFLAILLGLAGRAGADDGLALASAIEAHPQPADVEGSGDLEPSALGGSSGAILEPPDDEAEEDEATPRRTGGRRAPRRRESNGPRRVPTPHGASKERADRLGLGTRDAAIVLLHDPPERRWVEAAGRARPRTLRWPVDEGGFGRGVGYVRTDRPEVPHNGVDIVAPRGSIVHAAADGIVAYSDNGLRGYGNCVIILHADGRMTLYGHLDRATVQPGYRVRRGERIGFVGSTGHSQGPHLHFELRDEGRPLDPMGEFRGKPWVEGRSRLNALRAQPGGGHRRDHLGEIVPDFSAEPEADAPARTATREEAPARTATREEAPARTATREEAPARTATREETPARTASRTEPASRLASRDETRSPAAPETAAEPSVAERPPARVRRLLERGADATLLASLPGRLFSSLLWPTRGGRDLGDQDTLRIAVDPSTAVRASADGRVLYVGQGLDGTTTSVVLLHKNGWITIYSGVGAVHVEVGDDVERGSWIAAAPERRSTIRFDLVDAGRTTDPRARLVGAPLAATDLPTDRARRR